MLAERNSFLEPKVSAYSVHQGVLITILKSREMNALSGQEVYMFSMMRGAIAGRAQRLRPAATFELPGSFHPVLDDQGYYHLRLWIFRGHRFACER